MKEHFARKVTLAGLLVAVAVVGSTFSFPVFSSKCAPVQHMVNILCAVLLGPGYGVAAAFAASLLRNLLGLGSLLAFPGSMCGALLCGLMYKKTRNLPATLCAEVFGTGIIGGLLSYPIHCRGLYGRGGRQHRVLCLCGAVPGVYGRRVCAGGYPGILPGAQRRHEIHAGGHLTPAVRRNPHDA